jgi:two-component system response regulator AtoC
VSEVLARPARPAAVWLALRRARERTRLRRRAALLEHDLTRAVGERPIVAASPIMSELLEQLERVAGYETPLLLTGESGSGREGIARAVHAQSPRRSGAFVAVGCARGSEVDRARRLFGRAHGSLAGGEPGALADADGGTLYLDAVEALPGSLQLRLADALSNDERSGQPRRSAPRCDARVIAATADDLEDRLRRGSFHKELYEQLSGTRLRVPALRERPQDIPLLVDHFLARAGAERGRSLRTVTGETLERLVAYRWPGNVRELAAVIERAAVLAERDGISPRELPDDLVRAIATANELALKPARRSFETDLIRRALRATGGNRTRAARLLEISHRALLYKLKEYGLG